MTRTPSKPKPPSIEELVKQARATPPAPRPLRDYSEVIRILHHERNLSGVQISRWLKSKGCREYTASTIYKLIKELGKGPQPQARPSPQKPRRKRSKTND